MKMKEIGPLGGGVRVSGVPGTTTVFVPSITEINYIWLSNIKHFLMQ